MARGKEIISPIKRVTAILLMLCITAACSCSEQQQYDPSPIFAFDTLFEQTVWVGDGEVPCGIAEYLATEELIYSHTNENSELYQLNLNGGGQVSPDLQKLLNIALELHELTDGAFDPALGHLVDLWEENSYSLPDSQKLTEALNLSGADKITAEENNYSLNGTKINLGGIAKGAAVGEILAEYIEADVASCIISCSSTVGITGTKPDGGLFKVGVRDPNGDGNEYIATVELSDCIISTSGDYERYSIAEDGTRYHHILDPVTGYPSQTGFRSVTVIANIKGADDLPYIGALTDALSTAVFVKGINEDSLKLLSSLSLEAIFVTDDSVYVTRRLEDAVALTNSGYTLHTAEVTA